MHDVKNILLFELQRQCVDFSCAQLELFYQQLQLKISEQNNDSHTVRREGDELRAFVLNQRNQSAYSLFEAAYVANIKLVHSEFEYLHYNLGATKNHEQEAAASSNLLTELTAQPSLIIAMEQASKRFSIPLGDLNQRLSVICQTKINVVNNLFTPITFAYALQQTMVEAQWSQHNRIAAFQLFDSGFIQFLGELYDDLNNSLAKQGILPNLRPNSPSDNTDREMLALNQQQLMQEHADSNFKKLKRRSTDKLNVPVDAANEDIHDNHIHAIDYVGQLFREALSHEAIGSELKSYLSRLYSPYVRLALSDEGFVDNAEHAAHRVLMSLVNAAAICDSRADVLQKPALLLQIKSTVEQLSDNTDINPRVFSELAFRFSAELRHTDRLMAAKANRKAQGQPGLQQLDTLRINIQRIIESKIHSYPVEAPKPVQHFLCSTWSFFITSLYADPKIPEAAAQNAFGMVDQILAYARPNDMQINPEFTDIAPSIREGFMRCGSEGSDVRQFLQQLMHEHKKPNTQESTQHNFSQAATE